MLHPSGLREQLPVLQLMRRMNIASTVEEEESGAGSTLIDGADVSLLQLVFLVLLLLGGFHCGLLSVTECSLAAVFLQQVDYNRLMIGLPNLDDRLCMDI